MYTVSCKASYRSLSLHIYGGGKLNLNSDMEKSERSDHFPEGTELTPWFFIMSAGTKFKCALKLSSPRSNKKKKKKIKVKIYILQGLQLFIK